jgi:protein-S-isoprenylcysteine O-methyltransferase Ste14
MMDLSRHLLWTAFWTSLWCVLHSVLITHTVRDAVRRLFPRWHAFGHLAYVVFSAATLAVLVAWWATLPAVTLWDWPGWWSWVRWLGVAEAGVLFWLGLRVYDGSAFLGLTQARDHLAGRRPGAPSFRATGILSVIRHPWYTGTLVLLVFCLPVTDVNLVWRLVFIVYVLVGTELEERKLLRDVGAPYAAYRRRVPRYLPLPSGRRRS